MRNFILLTIACLFISSCDGMQKTTVRNGVSVSEIDSGNMLRLADGWINNYANTLLTAENTNASEATRRQAAAKLDSYDRIIILGVREFIQESIRSINGNPGTLTFTLSFTPSPAPVIPTTTTRPTILIPPPTTGE